MPPADRLKQLRLHVVEDGPNLVKILKDKKLQLTFGGLQEEDKLQRGPKGFDPDHPQVEFLKLKHFMVWTSLPVKKLKQTKQATQSELILQVLVAGYKDAYKLVKWLRDTKVASE